MLKNISILVFVTSIFVHILASADQTEALQKLAKKYRSAQLVEMNVEKTVKSELLGKETKYIGKIFLANGKFRWENQTPEKSLIVFDGTTIWSEQTPPKEFGGEVQVAKGKVDKKNRSHILISSLVGADVLKNFKVDKQEILNNSVKLQVTPQGNELNIKSLQLVIDAKENILQKISYTDDIGNLTTMNFSGVKFLKKQKNKLFKYQPPKNAQVTDL